MSSIRETAKREADEAEQEEAEQEADAELDADDAPDERIETADVAPPLSEKDIADRMAKLEKEAERHAKRVAEIMGDDFGLLLPSPIDWTPGFVFDPAAIPLSDEQMQAVDALIGRASRGDYQTAKDAEPCGDCNALGDVLTGSRKQGQELKMCSACTGSGWRTKVPEQTAPPLYAVPHGSGQPPPFVPNGMQVADQWGRAAGHPHYGLDPSMVGV